VQSPELAAFDAALAQRLALPLGGEPFQLDYLLRMLRLAGFRDLAQLRLAVRELAEASLQLAEPYFRFTAAVWDFDHKNLESFSPGYSLVFLSHAHLARGPALHLEQLERLTRFYRELDFPDDEENARRIAGAFLEVLTTVE
jgi:hypothetical protein